MGQQYLDSTISLRNDSRQLSVIYDQYGSDAEITHNFQNTLYWI